MVNTEADNSFFGAYLRKKLKKNTWQQYWVVIREDRLLFMNENERKIAGTIAITGETKCAVLERRPFRWKTSECSKHVSERKTKKGKENCKFRLQTKRGVHLFKTDCQLNCKKWIQAIGRAVQDLCDSSDSTVKPASSTLVVNPTREDIYLKRENNPKTKRGFVYAVLNDDEESENQESQAQSAIQIQRKMSQTRSLVKGSQFQKRWNFQRAINTLSHVSFSSDSELLNEEL